MIKYIFILLFSISAFATLNEVDKTQINTKQLLVNGGFENGKAKWTASAGTFTVTGTSPMIGLYHATWDAAASADTLTTTAQAIPVGFYGRNGVASCVFTTASGTATHEIQAYDGSNILSEQTIVSNTSPVRTSTNFIFPSSGNISLRIYANANEPSVAIDDCFLTLADGFNISNVSQAQFIGSAYFATTASCIFTVTNTALTALSDTDCPGPTVELNPGPGVIQTTDVNAPSVTVNNLPPGRYRVTFLGSAGSSTGNVAAFAINDGANTYGQIGIGTTTNRDGFSVDANFEYTSAGNRTFQLYASVASGTLSLYNESANSTTYFSIYRYPTSSEQVFTADQLANSWSGYHDSTCSFARTNTAYGDPATDASCALVERTNTNFGTVTGSNNLPSITFTPKKVGRYFVCARFNAQNTTQNTISASLYDGSSSIADRSMTVIASGVGAFSLCGILGVSSTSAKTLSIQTASASGTLTLAATSPSTTAVEWSIFAIDQSVPAPLIKNGVVGSSSGVVKVVSAYITNSGTPTVSRQDGSWISSITDNAVGDSTINITANTFSSTPNCSVTQFITAGSNGGMPQLTASSSTAVRVLTYGQSGGTPGGANGDYDYSIICVGAN